MNVRTPAFEDRDELRNPSRRDRRRDALHRTPAARARWLALLRAMCRRRVAPRKRLSGSRALSVSGVARRRARAPAPRYRYPPRRAAAREGDDDLLARFRPRAAFQLLRGRKDRKSVV